MKAMDKPLYDLDGKITSYYVEFTNADGSPNGYLVVGASNENPSVLEFGFGMGSDIQESTSYYYGGFGGFFTKDYDESLGEVVLKDKGKVVSTEKKAKEEFKKIWKDFKKSNKQAKDHLKKLKDNKKKDKVMVAAATPTRDPWDIYDGMPPMEWTVTRTLSGATSMSIYNMGQFKNVYNHCGSVAALNVLKYFDSKLNYSTLVQPDKDSAFRYLYTNTGNGGPTLAHVLLSALTSYINDRKIARQIPSTTSISTYDSPESLYFLGDMTSHVDNGRMPLMLIWKGLEAHWVNIVAYYGHYNGNYFVRIINNWDSDINRYYMFSTGGTPWGSIGAILGVKITK